MKSGSFQVTPKTPSLSACSKADRLTGASVLPGISHRAKSSVVCFQGDRDLWKAEAPGECSGKAALAGACASFFFFAFVLPAIASGARFSAVFLWRLFFWLMWSRACGGLGFAICQAPLRYVLGRLPAAGTTSQEAPVESGFAVPAPWASWSCLCVVPVLFWRSLLRAPVRLPSAWCLHFERAGVSTCPTCICVAHWLSPRRCLYSAESCTTFRCCNGKPLRGAARPCSLRKAALRAGACALWQAPRHTHGGAAQ